MEFYYTTDRALLKGLFKEADADFFPNLSLQESNLDAYIDRLVTEGRVMIAEENGKKYGVFGYFKSPGRIPIDILWLRPEKRKTHLFYDFFEHWLNDVKDDPLYQGAIEAKTWEGNRALIQILEKVGFKQTSLIPGEYAPNRTSVVYTARLEDIVAHYERRRKP